MWWVQYFEWCASEGNKLTKDLGHELHNLVLGLAQIHKLRNGAQKSA